MTSPNPLTAVLVVRVDNDDGVRGWAYVPEASPRRFSGALGLLAVIEGLRDRACGSSSGRRGRSETRSGPKP